MHAFMKQRIAYGRSIRERAEQLIEAHGARAEAEAMAAAQEPGAAVAERSFWESVAARVARELGHPRMPAPL